MPLTLVRLPYWPWRGRALLRNRSAIYLRLWQPSEVEKLALDLPESQRAVLATRLLRSLSPVLQDEDEGIAEAFLRDADLDTNPELGMSLEQLDQQIERRRS